MKVEIKERMFELLKSNLIEEYDELRKNSIPSILYKYSPLHNYTLECLEFNSVWVAKMDELNDPYEGVATLNHDKYSKQFFADPYFQGDFLKIHGVPITSSEVSAIQASDKPYQMYHKLCLEKGINVPSDESHRVQLDKMWTENYRANVRELYRSCSFSERNDSILMWSHYGDQHKGICVAYELATIERVADYLFPINYSDTICDITPSEVGKMGNKKNSMLPALTKARDWSYECEWRLLFPVKGDNRRHFQMPKPVAIYLGTRFEMNVGYLKYSLRRIANERDIPLLAMEMHPSSFTIVPVAEK